MKHVEIHRPIAGPKAWCSDLARHNRSWTHALTLSEVVELDAALAANRRFLGRPSAMEKQHFSIPGLSRTLDRLKTELAEGPGFLVVRGIPVHKWTVDEVRVVFWGLSLNLGRFVREQVAEAGARPDASKTTTHSNEDPGDLLSLLCQGPQPNAPHSSVSSYHTIFNKVLEEHPEYLPPLFRGFPCGFAAADTRPAHPTAMRLPVFSKSGGQLTGRYDRHAILTFEQHAGSPKLSPLERAAIDAVADYARQDDTRFDLSLQAGDWLLVNSRDVLHMPPEREDTEADQNPWKLRIWFSMPTEHVAHEPVFGNSPSKHRVSSGPTKQPEKHIGWH